MQGKVNLSLCLTKHYAMKTYGRVNVYVFLISSLVVGECSASRPFCFTAPEKAIRSHCTGGRVKILDHIGTRAPNPLLSNP
jgi:hypothetical protein